MAEPESKSRRIVIEQIRELEHTLQMRAADGQKKIVIISEADRLQPQAANAFLKTLEEPPANSLLLLLSALPEALPDTIISRCNITIPLSPGAAKEPPAESAGSWSRCWAKLPAEKKWSVPGGLSSCPRRAASACFNSGGNQRADRGGVERGRGPLPERDRWDVAGRSRRLLQGADRKPLSTTARGGN